MTKRIWRGDAPDVCQETHVTFSSLETGDVLKLKINNVTLAVTSADGTVADVVNQFVTAVSGSSEPEWLEVVASAGTDNPDDPYAPVTHLVLKAATCGVPFVVTSDTEQQKVAISEQTQGVAGANEVQKIELQGSVTGGTFTMTIDLGAGNETTAAIAYDATASAVQTAIEGLASVSAGDVVVTGGPGPDSDWFVAWQGTYAETEVNEFSVDGSSLTGTGTGAITVATTTEGRGASDEIQWLFYRGGSDGSFTLQWGGAESSSINVSGLTAAALQTEIENLGIGSGNVAVHGGQTSDTDLWLFGVHFTGSLAGTNVAALSYGTVDNGSGPVSGGFSADIRTLTQGGNDPADEVWFLDCGQASGGNFRITHSGNQTGDLSPTIRASDLQDALEALDSIGSGNVEVQFTGGTFPTGGGVYLIRFTGTLAGTSVADLTLQSAGLSGTSRTPSLTKLFEGGAATDEVQEIRVWANAGSFTLSDGTDTTSSIAFGATAATVETRLEADITAIADVSVTGTGAPDDPYVVTWVDPTGTDAPEFTGDSSSLDGGDGLATEVEPHATGTNEVQRVTIDGGVTAGTFTLEFADRVTDAIAFDAAAADVQTALEALSSIGSGNVSVSGSAGGPWDVTFQGDLASQDVALMVADASNLTGGSGSETVTITEEARSAGENHWDDPLNWIGERIPESGDEIWIDGGPAIKYGLRQSVTFTADAGTDTLTMTSLADFREGQKVRVSSDDTLPAGLSAATDYFVLNLDRDNSTLQVSTSEGGSAVNITDAGTGTHAVRVELDILHVTEKFVEQLGLPVLNEDGTTYYEYRDRNLKIELDPGGQKKVVIGGPNGSGPGLARFDFVNATVDVLRILSTGGATEPGRPAMTAIGSALSKIVVIDGHFGVAVFPTETATVTELQVRGGEVEVGRGVTLTTLDKTGGLLQADEATLNGTALID